jgi:hypothetical protein
MLEPEPSLVRSRSASLTTTTPTRWLVIAAHYSDASTDEEALELARGAYEQIKATDTHGIARVIDVTAHPEEAVRLAAAHGLKPPFAS